MQPTGDDDGAIPGAIVAMDASWSGQYGDDAVVGAGVIEVRSLGVRFAADGASAVDVPLLTVRAITVPTAGRVSLLGPSLSLSLTLGPPVKGSLTPMSEHMRTVVFINAVRVARESAARSRSTGADGTCHECGAPWSPDADGSCRYCHTRNDAALSELPELELMETTSVETQWASPLNPRLVSRLTLPTSTAVRVIWIVAVLGLLTVLRILLSRIT